MATKNTYKSLKTIKIGSILKYAVLIIFSFLNLVPFLWVILSSFKLNDDIYARPFSLPKVWNFENYTNAWVTGKLGSSFFNSIFISIVAVAITVLLAAMAAYVLARVRPSLALYTYFTVGIMVPMHAVLIPSFILVRWLGLMNSTAGLIIMYVAESLSISIFILVGFLKDTPKEVEEAALIDGCDLTQTFFRIILPIAKPGLATAATLAFLNCWNDYLFASVIIRNPALRTLTQSVFSLKGEYIIQYGMLCAGLAISIIPVTIMYVIFQEQVIKGMTAGAVKG